MDEPHPLQGDDQAEAGGREPSLAEDEARALLAVVGRWLRHAPAAGEAEEPEVGTYQLVEAFTALRHEIKLQTKGARVLGEQTEGALQALGEATREFHAAAEQARAQQAEGRDAQRLARPLALALAEFDEAVERGLEQFEKARRRLLEEAGGQLADQLWNQLDQKPWWRRWGSSLARQQLRDACQGQVDQTLAPILDTMLQGYRLMQQRLRHALEQQEIHRLHCIGRPVDPQTMTVAAVAEESDAPPGHVVEEIRPGYRWGDQMLRAAEVRAAKEAAGS